MKKLTAWIMLCCMCSVLLLGTGVTVQAASSNTEESAEISSSDPRDESSSMKTKPRGGGAKDATRVNVLKTAASVLGKSVEEIREAVRDGKIGDLLIAAGKVEDFKAAYLAEAKAKLDTAVANGTLTQTEADEKYATAKTKMDSYDGTTHLCGGKDHGKMFEQKNRSNSRSADA